MISVSLCMIVKNEQDVICRCLDSVKDIVDEIIVVDTGSEDRTKELVLQYTHKLYDYLWNDDFAAARNFSFSKATMEYIIWLDADDVLGESSREGLLRLKESMDRSVDIVMMDYHVSFDTDGNPSLTYKRERLMKRSKNYLWVGEIHETITPEGNIMQSQIAVTHKKLHPNPPMRNLKIFEKLLRDGKILSPRQQYYYGRELYYNERYDAAIEELERFLDGQAGWLEDCIGACKVLADCLYLQNHPEHALNALLRSLSFTAPRAEICCDIGKHFMSKQQYQAAIFWYSTATACTPADVGGFMLIDCYGYIPYMQLCVCYDKLGDIKKAHECNENAGRLKPADKGYLYNKAYFSGLAIADSL